MKTRHAIQYTIRGIPSRLDQLVRRMAKKTGKSVNQVVLETMNRGAGIAEQKNEYDDLDSLIGSWQEDPGFDEAVQSQHQIDPDLWR